MIQLSAFTQTLSIKTVISETDTLICQPVSDFKIATKLLIDRERLIEKIKSDSVIISVMKSISIVKDSQLDLLKTKLTTKDSIILNQKSIIELKSDNEAEYKTAFDICNKNQKKVKRRSKLFGIFFGMTAAALSSSVAYIMLNK